MFRTHIVFGLLIGLFVLPAFPETNLFLFLFLVAFGAGLPDIDHPDSVMGRKVKIIGWIFDHRGFFHSFFAVVLFGLLGFAIFKNEVMGFALALGYLSHLIGDALTHEGIAPFNPILKFRISGFFSTGHLIERILFIVFIGGIVLKLFTLVHL